MAVHSCPPVGRPDYGQKVSDKNLQDADLFLAMLRGASFRLFCFLSRTSFFRSSTLALAALLLLSFFSLLLLSALRMMLKVESRGSVLKPPACPRKGYENLRVELAESENSTEARK